MCLVMLSREKGAFLLDHSLHARLFQVLMNCVWKEGLVNDIGQSFGDLDHVFCFARSDQMDGMMDIGRRKLGWMTSNRLLKLRTLLRAKSGYGGRVDTSSRGNGASRVTSIKHSQNGILVSREEGSHDNNVGNQEVCEYFSTQTSCIHVYLCLHDQIMTNIM